MDLFINIAIFIASLIVLVKASDYFVNAAERIGLALGMSSFVVGVVIVGIGTSLPELVSSVLAVVGGSSEIVIGNVLGSNITNILLVLGVAAVIGKEFSIDYDLMKVDLPILLGSSFLLALMIWDTNFSTGEAILCLICLVIYILNSFVKQPELEDEKRETAGGKYWMMLLLSPVFIFLGAKFTVDSVIAMSKILGIGAEVIALSAVALGTSLPEVMVTISATRKGNPEMAIGNIIGSNIFNTFVVMGVSALVGTLTIPKAIIEFSLPVFIFATVLYVVITMDKKVNRWEGGLLLAFYLFFIGQLYGWI